MIVEVLWLFWWWFDFDVLDYNVSVLWCVVGGVDLFVVVKVDVYGYGVVVVLWYLQDCEGVYVLVVVGFDEVMVL